MFGLSFFGSQKTLLCPIMPDDVNENASGFRRVQYRSEDLLLESSILTLYMELLYIL